MNLTSTPDEVWCIYVFETIGRTVMFMELGLGMVMIGMNSMYLKRFWMLDTYHKSFRQTFMGVNVVLSMTAICHPLSDLFHENFTFESAYQIINISEYIIQYTSYVVDHVAIVFLHMKFYILAFERTFAFRRRAYYEHEDNNLPLKILVVLVSLILLEVAIKVFFFVNFDQDDSQSVRVLKGISLWKSPSFFLFSYILYYSSVLVGLIFFKNINRILAHYRYHSQSLSESFEIHQTEKISRIMWPVLKACVGVGFISIPSLAVCVHQALFDNGSAVWESAYMMSVRFDYFVVSIYTFFSFLYAFHKFGIVLSRNRSHRVADVVTQSSIACNENEQDNYFKILHASWENIKKVPKSLPL